MRFSLAHTSPPFSIAECLSEMEFELEEVKKHYRQVIMDGMLCGENIHFGRSRA